VILLPIALAGVMRLINAVIVSENCTAATRIAARPMSKAGAT